MIKTPFIRLVGFNPSGAQIGWIPMAIHKMPLVVSCCFVDLRQPVCYIGLIVLRVISDLVDHTITVAPHPNVFEPPLHRMLYGSQHLGRLYGGGQFKSGNGTVVSRS